MNKAHYSQKQLDQELIKACNHSFTICVSLLLEAGANPNFKEKEGISPIYMNHFISSFAEERENLDIFKLLIQYGVDVNEIHFSKTLLDAVNAHLKRYSDRSLALLYEDRVSLLKERAAILLNNGAKTYEDLMSPRKKSVASC